MSNVNERRVQQGCVLLSYSAQFKANAMQVYLFAAEFYRLHSCLQQIQSTLNFPFTCKFIEFPVEFHVQIKRPAFLARVISFVQVLKQSSRLFSTIFNSSGFIIVAQQRAIFYD